MRILLIMDPGIPVPPKLYGGHERLVALFAGEYVELGHEVTLLAGPDSTCEGTTQTFGVNDLRRGWFQKMKEAWYVWRYLRKRAKNFDLIHNFGRLIYLLPVLNHPVKKIMTYGRQVAPKGIRIMNKLPNKNLVFTACSEYCVSTGNVAGHWETVYNAIDFNRYQLNEQVEADAPLIFLGRLDKIKGVHTAISVAKNTGQRLWIGGNKPDTADNLAYFHSEIKPLFDDEQIIYLGPLDDRQKNTYLRQASAFLFPIEWDEPFGLVMIEAMACGTPVIGFKRGAVPEVVTPGVSGFVVQNQHQMENALHHIHTISRSGCREAAKSRFDSPIIARQYLELFHEEDISKHNSQPF